MEVRDNQGRKIGTVGYADYSWVTCLTVIIVIVAIIGGGIYGIGMLVNQAKGHNVHTHDSLRNIQLPNGDAGIVSSDSDGLHITDSSYTASSDDIYGDVDVSVTAKLVSYAHPDNPGALATYGIAVLQGGYGGQDYFFQILPNGKWLRGYTNMTDSSTTGTPDSAIRTGKGATNTLTVKIRGHHFSFLVNGTSVDEEDLPGAPDHGAVQLIANNAMGDPPATITVIFTDLSIDSQ